MDNEVSYSQKAMDNFLKGYNCAQSVVLAYKDMLDLPESELMKLACSFGGGMGRLRQVCGSVSGMFMVLGLLYGYDGPETGEVKAKQYERVQELAKRFEKEYGSIVCHKLLGLPEGAENPKPSERTAEYYKKRPCKEIIGYAASILDEYIKENPL